MTIFGIGVKAELAGVIQVIKKADEYRQPLKFLVVASAVELEQLTRPAQFVT